MRVTDRRHCRVCGLYIIDHTMKDLKRCEYTAAVQLERERLEAALGVECAGCDICKESDESKTG